MSEPIWENCGYIGLFGDAYVAGTELENTHIAKSLVFLQLLLKKVIQRGAVGLEAVRELLARSVQSAERVLRAQKPSELLELLELWTQLLEQLAVGEELLVPGGWRGSSTNWVVLLVERGVDDFAVTVCNRGPSAVTYHPSKFVADGIYGQKLKVQAALTWRAPKERLLDPGFWALAFGQWVPNATEYHRAEVLYDVLLPWLGGRPEQSGAWRTPCRSNTSCMKALLEALRLVCVRRRVEWRPLLLKLRMEALLLGAEELLPRPYTPSVMADAARSLLAAYTAPRLRERPSASCQVMAVFFSLGPMAAEIHRRLSQLVTAVWEQHGGGSLAVYECPLDGAGRGEWPLLPAELAQTYGVEEEPQVLLFRADGQLKSKEGLQLVLKDPMGRQFPWEAPALDTTGAQLLRWGARSLAKRQKESRELGRVAKAVHVLVGASLRWAPRAPLRWRMAAGRTALSRGELLRRVEVDGFAGAPEDARSAGFVDFLSIASSVTGAGQGVQLLISARDLAKASVRRAREASVGQRVALEMETVAFISSVMLDTMPVPSPPGTAGFWDTDLTTASLTAADAQRAGLRAVLDLTSLYACSWQGLERAERSAESERLLAVCHLLCVFEALLLRQVENGSLLADLLREDGGACFHLGLCADLRPLYEVLERVEILEPRWLRKRREILSYWTSREKTCRSRIFDFRTVGISFEVRKYSATMALLRKVLERCGLELVPRNQPMTEMEALAEWLFGRQLLEACPEMCWCRDMAMLFKFLATMEPRSSELLRKRRDTNEYQFWRLTFDGDMASRPGFGWAQDVPAIHWEVQGVRGADQDIADVTASAFGRELSLGEGLVVHSPADVARLLERPNCTEDDVLHSVRLPHFEETLGPDEAEALMSFLTVPYLQLPLVLDFFASQDRATYLFKAELQRLLRAVLFEPRAYQEQAAGCSLVPARVRVREDEPLEQPFGTPLGLLLGDLCHSPASILEPLQSIFRRAQELGQGDAYSAEAPFLLFMLELAGDVLRFVEFALELEPQEPQILQEASAWLRSLLAGTFRESLLRWTSSCKDVMDSCAVHSYLALEAFESGLYIEGLSSWCLCRTWHSFGGVDMEEAELSANERLRRFLQAQGIDTRRTSEEVLKQFTQQEGGRYRPVFLRVGQQTVRVPNFRGRGRRHGCSVRVPEARIFRALQSSRRQLVAAFAESPSASLTLVAQTGLRGELQALEWRHKGGGVFVADELQLNVQTGELLWREDGLKPLPDSMTRFEDFETIFGDTALQCGLISRSENRLWVHLVGKSFDLMEWKPSPLPAFKQGAGGPEELSTERCARCGGTGCWQCPRCTMINCKAQGAAETCVACGGPAPGSAVGGRPKLEPVTSCVFLGRRFVRPLDIYEPQLAAPEGWLADVLLPVLLELYPPEPEDRRMPYQLLLPEEVSQEDELHLLGFDRGPEPKENHLVTKEDEQKAATWKEIVVSRLHESVMVYNLVPHARRFYRSLVFSSRSALALHDLPLDTPDAQKLLGASGSFGDLRRQEGSLCICRLNKELGLAESYISPRLLRGVVPSCLLERYSFWEGEDGLIRGLPSDEQSTHFAKNLEIKLLGDGLQIRRLAGRFSRPEGSWRGLRRPEDAPKQKRQVQELEVLQLAELGFPMEACRLALESCGDAARAAEWLFDEGNTAAIFAAVDGQVEDSSMVEVEAPVATEMDCDEGEELKQYLVDLLHGGSELASLCKLLLRVEDLSHILAWAGEDGDIVSIELPRLKLTLLPREGRLEVKDFGGWFVKSEDDMEPLKLLEGLEQALLLENASGDLRVLLPNHDVTRPLAKGQPFSTKLIFNRSSFGWQEAMDFPYYLYPVHTTYAFLQAPSLAASLYLALLRLLLRDYSAAFAELENCWTDVPLLPEEKWVFNQFGGEDQHPDAHAVRCKLALQVAFLDLSLPFELHVEVDHYLAKRHHVSRGLWLNEEEELQLLRRCKSSTRRVKARLEYLAGKARGQAQVVLRSDAALQGGQPWMRLNLMPKEALRRATHVRRLQFRHPMLPENQLHLEWPKEVGGEVLVKILWQEELLQDDESGVNRQLGFIFLYQVLLGQMELNLNGRDVTSSLGSLLARVFHLKLARWGKELQDEGEEEVQLSRQLATLALLERGASAAGWPPVPSAPAVRSALVRGQNLYDASGRESPLKMWIDAVDQVFQRLQEPVPMVAAPESWVPRMELVVEPGEVELRRRGSDDRCGRRELPAELKVHAGQEILGHLDLASFVSWKQEATSLPRRSPFALTGHACTRTAVAQDLLQRLDADCATYAELVAQRRLALVDARPERLEALAEVLRKSAAEDQHQIRVAIGEMLREANLLPESEEVFDFKLRRDLCHLEEELNFDYIMSCVVSSKAQEDLMRLNPYLAKPSTVISHAMAVSLLSGRHLQARKAAQLALRLAQKLRSAAEELATQQELRLLGEMLMERRCYLRQAEPFDPRFLLFEFMQHIVLRPRQVEMVEWFMKSYTEGESRVQQMIMGAGKTTVVGPLLSTMLAAPDALVTQVMPSPLLDQSRQILRSCFSKLLPKRIVTFQFDRQVDDCEETIMKIYIKLEACRRACGIVVSSPESIKSMLLKFIEQLHALAAFDFSTLAPGASLRSDRELSRQRETLQRRSGMADAAVRLVKLWRTGIVIMDEVDVLLHPLKSELNFPIGFRDPIDLSGHRWNLPIHIMEGIFYAGEQPLSDHEGPGGDLMADPQHEGHEILAELKKALQRGVSSQALQRMPHPVLLDLGFYQTSLKPLIARWVLLWLKKNFAGGSSPDEVLLQALLAEDPLRYKEVLESKLTPFSLKLFNLSVTWINAILPHVLSKIDRVSYGLLSKKQLEEADEKTPFSRLVMAVPFVGKDVPSRSSEFAHPDVALGLTILAYRYEGLRPSDVRSIVAQLKQDCARQLGPRDARPAHLLFESWVRQEEGSPPHKMRRLEVNQNILPLSLFQPTDKQQMARLCVQLQHQPCVAHFWLRQHVFPVTMNFHPLKISASGHELGSSLLFGYRLGFSGTPSNLLPQDLGECFYEPGSDGQVAAVLTDPKVTSAEVCGADWNPEGLLRAVATGQFHALIDTGALITNMDNEQVASKLLTQLPETFDGVVFLDPSDRKMILVRSSGTSRAVSLATSGVAPERRFAFFDQVHTTGMDILTAPTAKAVVTIGKDMNFRDYAQGAFRMRKVGQGQTIHLFVIPEVQARVEHELGAGGSLIVEVPKWLLLNSCRSESLQSLKLLAQELTNGWRKQALEHLCADVCAHEKMPSSERMRRFEGPQAAALRACLGPFQEHISFKVDDQLLPPRSYREALQHQCDLHQQFGSEERQQQLLRRIDAESQVAEQQEMNQGFAAEVVHEQEQEQQQEQEEEQEEEQENAFTRDDEQANPWRAQVLADAPREEGQEERPFYRLCHFRVRSEQPLLPLDPSLWLSDNFFRPSWVGLGERRLKTAFVLLEWHPEISQARQKRGMQQRVRKIFQEMQRAGVAPTEAAMKALTQAKESIRHEPLKEEEMAGEDNGPRYLVLVTLAEAETLRWLARSTPQLGFALRSLQGHQLEASAGFRPSQGVERLLSVVRLFNCEMFFGDAELQSLEAELGEVPLHIRQSWFEELLRLRRRRARFLWLDTPIARLFTPQEDWKSLRSQSLRCGLQRALKHFTGPLEELEALQLPMSREVLRQRLQKLRLGFAASEIQDAVNMLPMLGEVVASDSLQVEEALAFQRERRGLKAARMAQAEAEHLEKAQRVWSCRNCTFMNSALSSTCAVCDYGWTGQRECPVDKWCCTAITGGCTFFNPKNLFYCEVCGRVRPDLANIAF